jgi:CheY-like chemotaxis protein
MTKDAISTHITDMAEGGQGETETREPVSPMKTATLPAISSENTTTAPVADTGTISIIRTQAEGKENNDTQDASLTTAETTPVAVSQESTTAKSAHGPTVLIIEDTTELAEVIQATLERMNIVTAHETHGNKALSKFNEMNPDVVLLDIGLPDMTGWKLLDAIKEKKGEDGKMPAVIIITAYGDPANRLVGKLQGVQDYLIKPFTADEVEKVVKNSLSAPR